MLEQTQLQDPILLRQLQQAMLQLQQQLMEKQEYVRRPKLQQAHNSAGTSAEGAAQAIAEAATIAQLSAGASDANDASAKKGRCS